ncbi:uncharacterized protein LOC119651080 isoform X2 [Hermetia illucens]|uniref:uncharacterized protein LOC119651080 isoform X2 n=1 Tax=Hermetia illucens TaxID=343691 RepID=UPI0018CC0AF9|nr:uncharacterized protein LOC119651080 isoform X2 [Hermetia illucens]
MFAEKSSRQKMHGVKRVIIFCLLIVVLPATLIIVPLYLRHSVFADVVFPVTESDIIEVRDGISNIFCQQHSLRMNSSFNAFQLKTRPEVSTNHKHIRLKKSMTLPDDTLEYWGFYLLKGARVELKVCSRYDGSRILVVKGDRNLRTCGLLEHNQNKVGTHFAQGHEKVVVTFETAAELVVSDEGLSYGYKERQTQKAGHTTLDEEDENHGGEILDEVKRPAKVAGDIPTTLASVVNDEGTLPTTSEKAIVNASDKTEKLLMYNNLDKQNETDTHNDEMRTKPQHESTATEDTTGTRHYRHPHTRKKSKRHTSKGIYERHVKHNQDPLPVHRKSHRKRDAVYNRKISHGGNALNFTDQDSGSISSFENSLLTCYDGQILLAQGFPPSHQCNSVRFFESGTHMVSRHDVVEDGYYYYIFYSDNDLVRNDIHAVFDIYKPTFEYANLTDAIVCLNSTNCTFPITLSSEEVVLVEVPTRDGIEHEEDDVTYLISTCHPRMAIYLIFPISVLILILSCAFI